MNFGWKIMCHCWFINYNKCAILLHWRGMLMAAEAMCRGRGYVGTLYFLFNFALKLKQF